MIQPERSEFSAFLYYRRLGKVKSYVEENFSSAISLKDAAAIAGLEETYFSKFFRHKTGICFRDWVAQLRIEQAKALLMRRNYTITETCFAVGFRDRRTFERTFKKYTGKTPRQFKLTETSFVQER